MGGQGHQHGLTGLVEHVRGVLNTPAVALPQHSQVVVAVSGGADSVALLHLVVAARPDLRVVVAHVRHALRDDARDARAAVAAADRFGLVCTTYDVQVGEGDGPEDAARRARHTALATAAAQHGAGAVLLGHTADDQAETVLLRIARGTGLDGLRGMAVVANRDRVRLIRPLLGLRRHAVRAVPEPGTWVEDPTNRDPDQRRARARHEAIPALGRLRPDEGDPVPALCRLADLAGREVDALEAVETGSAPSRYGPAVLVPRYSLPAAARWALQARVIRRAWAGLPGHPPAPSAAVIDEVLALPHGRRTEVSGGVAVIASERGWVLRPTALGPLPTRDLPIGGSVVLPEIGVLLHCEEGNAPPDTPTSAPDLHPAPWMVCVPPAPGPLQVAGRGSQGARDVRDVLHAVVPIGIRDLVPIIRDADGRALAVGAHALAPAAPGEACIVLTATSADHGAMPVGYPPDP